MASISLNNGHHIPVIGLGTWQSKPGEVQLAVKTAVEAGYRLIDCAYVYGNEAEVGQALIEVISKGTVKREELFIISKLWNTRHHKEDVKPSVLESLSKLGLSYLDLYLIHWPIAFERGSELFPKDGDGNMKYDSVSFLETWKALEECVDEGLIKSIGLSNFNSKQIQEVIDNSRIKPVALQVEVHPYFSQEKLVNFCQKRNIVVIAYSCFASPARPWAQADGDIELPLDDATVISIANRLGKSPAQVILRWLIQRNVVPIPKSVTPSRIQANFQIFDFELSSDDLDAINKRNRDQRFIIPRVERNGERVVRDKDAPNYPFNEEF